jgi:hypothetical protein
LQFTVFCGPVQTHIKERGKLAPAQSLFHLTYLSADENFPMNPFLFAAAILSYQSNIKAGDDLFNQSKIKLKLLGFFFGALSAQLVDVFFDDQGRQSDDGDSWRSLEVGEKGPGEILKRIR